MDIIIEPVFNVEFLYSFELPCEGPCEFDPDNCDNCDDCKCYGMMP